MTKRKNGDKYTTSAWQALIAAVEAYAREQRWHPNTCELTMSLIRKELDRAAVAWADEQGGAE